MIVEIIMQVETYGYESVEGLEITGLSSEEALTAIYEIGLECIGVDIKPHKEPGLGVEYATYLTNDEAAQNDLRASQRKAWAKACGVAEK